MRRSALTTAFGNGDSPRPQGPTPAAVLAFACIGALLGGLLALPVVLMAQRGSVGSSKGFDAKVIPMNFGAPPEAMGPEDSHGSPSQIITALPARPAPAPSLRPAPEAPPMPHFGSLNWGPRPIPILRADPAQRRRDRARARALTLAKQRAERRAKRFSFAVISDTHRYRRCRVGQGVWVAKALERIRRRKPAFVIGLGDLIAGGGDCGRIEERQPDSPALQWADFARSLLKPLKIPFIPVAGNHDLGWRYSWNRRVPLRSWQRFWRSQRKRLFPAARRSASGRSFRFVHQGVGFAMISYYGSRGLHRAELNWVRRNVRRGDLVFRHVNPYGISCVAPGECGFSLTSHKVKDTGRLVRLLKRKKVTALFAGHTHAFYAGRCDGLAFVNSGTLAERALEFVRGWEQSPYRNRQSFVWVDVLPGQAIRTTFYVWEPAHKSFRRFNPKLFPAEVRTRRHHRVGYIEGVAARCRRFGSGPKQLHVAMDIPQPRRPRRPPSRAEFVATGGSRRR